MKVKGIIQGNTVPLSEAITIPNGTEVTVDRAIAFSFGRKTLDLSMGCKPVFSKVIDTFKFRCNMVY